MGGTLPLFCRQFISHRDLIVSGVGRLYALNTLGAVAGCMVAGFWLIPAIGIRASIFVAAVLNVAAAATALLWDRKADRLPEVASRAGAANGSPRVLSRRIAVLTAILFFLTGAVALANEVLWTRFAALLVASTVTTYSLTIGLVLLGIAIGGLLVARVGRAIAPAFWFGALQALLAVWVITITHLPPWTWESLGNRTWMYLLLFLPRPPLLPLVLHIRERHLLHRPPPRSSRSALELPPRKSNVPGTDLFRVFLADSQQAYVPVESHHTEEKETGL